MDFVILLGQCVFTWLPALWLMLGAVENIRNPRVNEELVADTLSMRRMAAEYPEYFAVFGRNRIVSGNVHRLVFRIIVVAEVVVALVFCAGAAALTLALLGVADPETARVWAALGAVGFTAIWGGFLVGGQWFHYWCGLEGSQMTHFVMVLWGLSSFLVLTI